MASISSMDMAPLSGSTNGRGQKLTGTNDGGAVVVHTAVAGTTSHDVIWIWAMNTSASDVTVTVEWGGTTAVDDIVTVSVPASSKYLLIDGWVLRNGLTVRMFASAANVVSIYGYVQNVVRA